MHENNILKGKLDIIRKEQERKALEVFKNQMPKERLDQNKYEHI